MTRSTNHLLLAFFACAFFAFAPSGQARLGESEAKCQERYGAIVERVKPTSDPALGSDQYAAVFKSEEVRVVIEFKDGVAWKLTYEGKRDLRDHFEILLKRNNEGKTWGEPLEAFGRKHWIRPDGNAHAVGSSDPRNARLILITTEYLKTRAKIYADKLKDPEKYRDEYINKTNPLPGF